MRKLFLLLSNIAGKGIIVSVWVVSKSLMHFLDYNGCKNSLYNVYKQTKNLYLDDNDNRFLNKLMIWRNNTKIRDRENQIF